MQLSQYQWLSVSLGLLGAAVQFLLCFMMWRRRAHKDFPIFFGYNGFYVLTTLVLTGSYLSQGLTSSGYFYLYWILNSILMILEFGIMYEVFVHAVKPYSGLIDLAKMLFWWAAAFLVIAAALTAFETTGSALERCVAAAVYVGRSLRLMQCGLLLLFFFFERRLGLSWRTHSICAALGLSTVAAVGLSLTYLRTRYPSYALTFDLIENGTFLSVVAGWLICFRLPEPKRRNVLDSPSKLIFQRWNETLLATPFAGQGNFSVAGMDTFLPNVERTVERVMARKMVQ